MTHYQGLLWRYIVGAALLTLLGFAAFSAALRTEGANAALLLQLTILVIAVRFGRTPSIIAALVSTLLFHVFFVPPIYSLLIESREDLVRLLLFLVVAVSTSSLASRARAQAEAATQRASAIAALYELSQRISAQVELGQILPLIAATTCRLLQVPSCAVLLYDANGILREHARHGASDAGQETLAAPLYDGAVARGVLRIAARVPEMRLSPAEKQLLDTLAAQACLAVERASLAQQAAQTQALAQSDQIKSALLASVSHDLRTPLAAIKGSATALLADDLSWEPAAQRTLFAAIERAANRLDRIVANLLDMSRLEAGALPLERAWHDIPELIGATLQHLAPLLGDREVRVAVASDLPLVKAHGASFDHVLTNLLENAVKYTPPTSPLLISAAVAGAGDDAPLLVSVRDYGPGIAPEALEHIFEKFYRGQPAEAASSGSGLGLAICKGIVEAHGGTIWAANCPDGGAIFSLTLPHEPCTGGSRAAPTTYLSSNGALA